MAGPRWAKIDTSYFINPKITGLSDRAVLLHLASILYSADQLTDGFIAAHQLPIICQSSRIQNRWRTRTVHELIAVSLWEPNGDDGWHIHDFDKMNPQAMRHVVESQRKAWREAKR